MNVVNIVIIAPFLGLEKAILVTCRYEEFRIREKAKDLGVKIIPKNFAPYIPIIVSVEC